MCSPGKVHFCFNLIRSKTSGIPLLLRTQATISGESNAYGHMLDTASTRYNVSPTEQLSSERDQWTIQLVLASKLSHVCGKLTQII